MKKCRHPDHPHCTYWVLPGEGACAGGHPQAAIAPSSYDVLSAMRQARVQPGSAAHAPAMVAMAATALTPAADAALPPSLPSDPYSTPSSNPAAAGYPSQRPAARPQLHISGFDPRAAGGRQTLKMELRGMPDGCAPELALRLQSELIPHGAARQRLARTADGGWRPVFAEFSSRDKEHGQYQISVEIASEQPGMQPRRWECTFVILVPRLDATLTEIHRIFLSTHKNVRVTADDASIARVQAQGGDNMDLEVTARNAGIAHVNLEAPAQQGKIDLGFSTIAWDEDLIEIAMPRMAPVHPHPSRAASFVNAAPAAGMQRHIRLFAQDECVIGRMELVDPDAHLLLSHHNEDGQQLNGLTRRLSGRHAVIRRASTRPGLPQGGFEIEDLSRYGILLDGVWPGKHAPVRLRHGMRIELSASIKGILTLVVSAILPHGVILHRVDEGANAECFYILMPDTHPGYPLPPFTATPQAAGLPLLVHHNGGFWHLDQLTGKETALAPPPGATQENLSRVPAHTRFTSEPYPESWIIRTGAHDGHEGHSTVAASDLSAA